MDFLQAMSRRIPKNINSLMASFVVKGSIYYAYENKN
jgi:hypothetical protein